MIFELVVVAKMLSRSRNGINLDCDFLFLESDEVQNIRYNYWIKN